MSERRGRPSDVSTREEPQEQVATSQEEGGGPGSVGALDGAAAAGSLGAVGGATHGGALPEDAPDPGIGPH